MATQGLNRMTGVAALSCALALATVAAVGCRSNLGPDSSLPGSVVTEDVATVVPALAVPLPNLEAGFPPPQTPTPKTPQTQRPSAVIAATSLGQRSLIVSVPVSAADTVRAGDVVAVLDHAMLDAEVEAARAALVSARAGVKVLGARLNDVADARAEVSSNRSEAKGAIADATATRAKLVKQLGDAKSALAQVEKLLGSLPPGAPAPPGVPDPDQLRAGIAKLQGGITKIDAGLAKARSGIAKLDTATSDLRDARSALNNATELAGINVESAQIALDQAIAQRDMATVRSPMTGTVVAVPRVGDVLAPGAPLVVLRPDSGSRVRVWLEPEAAARIEYGSRAEVSIDSLPGESFPAKITLIGSRADVPPTSLATHVIHLIRAVPIEVTLDNGVSLPPGTPADVTVKDR